MAHLSAPEIVPLFSPSSSDWVVALALKDGSTITRRVSPGRVDEDIAIRYAMAASEVSLAMLDFYTVRRAEDRTLTTETNGDEFLATLRSKRR